jgi:hypothetical protein
MKIFLKLKILIYRLKGNNDNNFKFENSFQKFPNVRYVMEDYWSVKINFSMIVKNT